MNVVVRCPGCGADGGVVLHACETCGNQLRFWCRLHSKEIGWLEGDACVRCVEAAMRYTPPVRVPEDGAAPAPSPAGGVAAHVDGTAGNATAGDDPGLAGRVIAMPLSLLIWGGLGGLMGMATGFLSLTYGRGTVPGTPLQFGKAGVIVGLIFGFVVYARYVADLPGHAPPPSLPHAPDPAPIPRPAPAAATFDPAPIRCPDPASVAASSHPAAAEPGSLSRKQTQWPGGRSPREILRGPPKSRAELGLPEPLPPPQAADVASLGCGGAMFGMVAGWVAASVAGAGAAGAAMVGATVMGLGGLFVGIIRYVAIQRACDAENEG